MAFEKLQNLGEEKFRKITNELLRGEPCMTLARTILQEWGDLQGTAEKTLTQQLNRLRQSLAEGKLGKAAANQLAKGHIPLIKLGEGSTLECLAEMAGLVNLQKNRIIRFYDEERKGKAINTALSTLIEDTSKMVQEVQKMKFDLGLSEFKGTIVGKGSNTNVTLPDGTNVQTQVLQAYNVLDEVFKNRGIGKLPATCPAPTSAAAPAPPTQPFTIPSEDDHADL